MSKLIDGFLLTCFPLYFRVALDTSTKRFLSLNIIYSSHRGVVSKSIQSLTTEKNRPSDWYSTKNCSFQYSKLLDQVELLKKRRDKELPPIEAPNQFLLKLLTKSMFIKYISEHEYTFAFAHTHSHILIPLLPQMLPNSVTNSYNRKLSPSQFPTHSLTHTHIY